jgi:hypothetical protein
MDISPVATARTTRMEHLRLWIPSNLLVPHWYDGEV